ncbi:tyrosine-type recombinase/integrase [Clostridium beijerinckii]|uniref:tyrosine-type recombinase/integrase n=1 Tax=Clostridium beijerinckii TaxID=1520 RepID=UPI0003D347D9|nr:tyrosine-type recombinase/integrase [Clostridium beijerinckii]AQS18284.1 recombinase [Clostridium beijerinckii NRRL B-598]
MRKKGKNSSMTIKNPEDLKRIALRLKEVDYPAYILWSIAIGTGFRGGDLVKLTISDIKKAIETGKISIMEEKTEHSRKKKFEREEVLPSKLIKILKDYVYSKSDAAYIYPAPRSQGRGELKQHIRRDRLGKIFKSVIEDLGICKETDSAGTHTPRKSYGYRQYITHGKDINFVRRLFGHSKSETTLSYIGIDDDMGKDAAETMNNCIF